MKRQRHIILWMSVLVLTLGAMPLQQAALPDAVSEAPMLIRSTRGMAMLEAGRTSILQFRLDEAEATFTTLATLPDGGAAAAFYLETISLLKLIASDEDRYFDEFMVRSDDVRDVLSDASESPWRDFLEAEVSLHRALARGKRGQYMRAALAGRSAYLGYKRLIDDYPDFYDAYKGIGVLHVGIGSVSGVRRSFLKFLGFSGTVEDGVRELHIAAEQSLFNREEAQVFLAQIDMRLFGSEGNGGAMLEALWQQYPESPLFAHLYGSFLYETRQAEVAEDVFREVADRVSPVPFFYVDYIDFYLADVLFRQDRFAASMPYYRRYLDRHDGLALKATALLHLGLALEMQGQRDAAVAHYQQVQSTRDFESDATAQRRAQRLQATPLDEQTRLLLLGQNAYDSGRYERAHTLLDSLIKDPASTRDERAEAAYRQGRTFEAEGHAEEALAAYAQAVAWDDNPATRWAPWSHYYTGRLLAQRGETAAATQSFEAVLAYDGDYDYREQLERDVQLALERLKE